MRFLPILLLSIVLLPSCSGQRKPDTIRNKQQEDAEKSIKEHQAAIIKRNLENTHVHPEQVIEKINTMSFLFDELGVVINNKYRLMFDHSTRTEIELFFGKPNEIVTRELSNVKFDVYIYTELGIELWYDQNKNSGLFNFSILDVNESFSFEWSKTLLNFNLTKDEAYKALRNSVDFIISDETKLVIKMGWIEYLFVYINTETNKINKIDYVLDDAHLYGIDADDEIVPPDEGFTY